MLGRRVSESSKKAVFQSLLTAALEASQRQDYLAYIGYLDDLGIFLNLEYQQNHHPDYHNVSDNKALKIRKKNWLETYVEAAQIDLFDPLPICAFEEAWVDEHLKKPLNVNGTTRHRRYLSPKTKLNRSTRRNVSFGMRAVALAIKKQTLPLNASKKSIKKADKKACLAIISYRNRRQKFLNRLGIAIAIFMSVVCSIITAGAVAITVAAWPIAIAGIIVAGVFIATVIINWFSYRNLVPRLLNEAFGRDKAFEGWTVYNDPETGEKIKLSLGRKITLGFATAAALLMSMATGAVTYGSIIGLSKLALFAFITTSAAAMAALPPIGIAIALVFCVATFIIMMKPILNMVKAKNLKSLIKKPFEEAAAIFDPNHKRNQDKSPLRLKIEKGITYAALALFSTIAFFGLIVLQIRNGTALADFLSTTTAISSSITIGIAYTISMASTLIGQLPYTLKSIANGFVGVISGVRSLFSSTSKTKRLQESDESLLPSPNLPRAIKNRVFNGFKEIVTNISPNAGVLKEAKNIRLANLEKLTFPMQPSTPQTKCKNYQLYLFPPATPHQSPTSNYLSSSNKNSRVNRQV